MISGDDCRLSIPSLRLIATITGEGGSGGTYSNIGRAAGAGTEDQLIEACQKSEGRILGDGELPPKDTPNPSRQIHTDVLRYLIRGGYDKCKVDDISVSVEGAHITGTLDLDFTTASGAIQMPNSRFSKPIDCEQTECRQLLLDDSDLQGLHGQAMKVTGKVFLRNTATQEMICTVTSLFNPRTNPPRCDHKAAIAVLFHP